MSNRVEPTKSWDARDFTCYGALLGFVLSIGHVYFHAFWSHTSDGDIVQHLLWEMVLSAMIGAALSGAIAVIRNRLTQER